VAIIARHWLWSLATVVVSMLVASLALAPAESDSRGSLILVTKIPYTAHDAISIDGNAEFTGRRGVVSGDGTASAPYVIEGWDIDAWDGFGIDIRNTDAHLTLRNCYVHDGAYSHHYGIRLVNCTNFVLDGNLCPDNWIGIGLIQCYGGTLVKNNCTGCEFGNVMLDRSNDSVVRDNICDISFRAHGIDLSNSCNNVLMNNSCRINNFYGVSLAGSSCNNRISGNRILRNYDYGVRVDSLSSNNTIWNNTFVDNNDAGSSYDIGYAQAFDEGTDNSWNSSGVPHGYGNYWSDWHLPDSDFDGIVDAPYVIDAARGVKDSYPLTKSPYVPEVVNGLSESISLAILAATLILVAVSTAIVIILVLARRSGNKDAKAPHSQMRTVFQSPLSNTSSVGELMFCPYCGHKIIQGAVSCSGCGRKFS